MFVGKNFVGKNTVSYWALVAEGTYYNVNIG